ncbi:MAG TPA: lipid-binding SYLF domain-containing protein [Burkholderiaceae bacterium]|nr:lipid-binding SYLF domain-containing protein [Burkholderiaceae bacterium]
MRLLLVAMSLALSLHGGARAQTDQDQLVAGAAQTLRAFIADPQMVWLNEHLGQARAVLIAPQIVKAGFVIGGSGGHAVLIVRDHASGRWVGPAFYTLATASVGFQAGVAVSEVVMLVMTDKAVDRLLTTSFRLGGDIGIAAGPVGAGKQANLSEDIVAFSRSKGAYGGLNVDGSALRVADEWNAAYYGKAASPVDILVRANVRNPQAAALLAVIERAGR